MGFLDNAGLGTLWKNIVGKSIPYGYCTTGAATRAKTVTVSPAITELTAGVLIAVKFQYANTASTTSSAVTLNVNGLGAKNIRRYGSTNISNSAATSWNANSVVILTYDGTDWQLTDFNNTTYSGMTNAEYQAGTSGTNRLISPAMLKAAIQHWETGEANVQSDWEQTDSSADDFIKNKPTIPTDASEIAYDSHVSVATAISANTTAISNKVDKETGKGLSTNDYTTAEKNKLAGIAAGAEVNVNADWNATSGDALILNKPTIPTVPTNVSAFTNDANYVTDTDLGNTLSPYATKIDVVENLQATRFILNVSGTSASLLDSSGNPTDLFSVYSAYSSAAGALFFQIIGGTAEAPIARLYDIAEADLPSVKLRLVSVDGGVLYMADFHASDLLSPLSGIFQSQSISGGGGSEPTMNTVSVTSGGTGTWRYRIWPSGWQEAWYQGSIQFTTAASSAGGWYRSTKNFALPISFADDASILVSGATSGRVFTHGGIKTNGTQFEAQILGGAALAANTYAGWNVYVAGYGRS